MHRLALLLLCAVGVASIDLAKVRAVSYKEIEKPAGGRGVVDTDGVLEKGVVEEAIKKVKGEVYIVVVGRMLVEDGWKEEEETSDEGERVVRFSNSLAHRWRCTGDCILFVLSVSDRQLKLRCGALADYQIDDIISTIKEDLRERSYTQACTRIISLTYSTLSGTPPSWTFLTFVAVLLLFSISAVLLFPKHAAVWLALFILYLITTHWTVLVVTFGAALAAGFNKFNQQRPLSPVPDPWAVL
eukprot:TRINITY_DN807_c0_g1_i1.p1 TRINITY_DN807_c0_g1~~TRINITY_DN807_c0_g1_i1.p1  ORF type:complete len:243 (+),score=73.64 TRINITY_DN807_c0_g1_i1:68-796(+)